jgi:hypothetical protein
MSPLVSQALHAVAAQQHMWSASEPPARSLHSTPSACQHTHQAKPLRQMAALKCQKCLETAALRCDAAALFAAFHQALLCQVLMYLTLAHLRYLAFGMYLDMRHGLKLLHDAPVGSSKRAYAGYIIDCA